MLPSFLPASVIAFGLIASVASADFVTFDNVQTSNLPYSENGLTFSNLAGTSPAIVVGGTDGYLVAGTNTAPIHVRVSSPQQFDLVSLDIERILRDWRIESSSGAVYDVTTFGPHTIDFTNLSGWSSLDYFDVVHDPGEANGTIRVDNIQFNAVPEPSTFFSFGIIGILILKRRNRQENEHLLSH